MRRLVAVLAAASALLAVCLPCAGCARSEPEPTACPLPSLPPATEDPAGGIVPVGSVDPRCSGGTLSPSEAADLMADIGTDTMVIDIRTPAEYGSGHIPGAVNLSSQDASFWDRIGELPADGVYLLYCRTGSTTRRVMEQMLATGFGSVCHIGTGFNGWKNAGLPVEEGAA